MLGNLHCHATLEGNPYTAVRLESSYKVPSKLVCCYLKPTKMCSIPRVDCQLLPIDVNGYSKLGVNPVALFISCSPCSSKSASIVCSCLP